MADITREVGLLDKKVEASRETSAQEFYSTDDESTGQKCPSHKEKQHLQVDLNLEKILSKIKRDSVFELRRLSHQQRPVSEFGSKQTLLQHFANRPQPPALALAILATPHAEDGANAAEAEGEEPVMDVSARVQQLQPRGEEGEVLRPEEILQDMQILQELRVVNAILQGPVHEEIDQALREGMNQRQARRRPRPPRPPPRRVQAHEGGGEEGGDEMNQPPVGRLLAANGRSRRQRSSHGRRVRFRPQIPTPNTDGRYPVPARDQSMIVQRLRQSPALNSLGDEARDEIVAEVGGLVSQHLVTSALSGEFRGTLELLIQTRAEAMHRGHPGPVLGRRFPQEPQYSDDEAPSPAPAASAEVRELREEVVMVKGQLNELKQMMRVSFDLQLDIQRAIRQEVAAALTAFLTQQPPTVASGTPAPCPIPTLGEGARGSASGGRSQVVESGHCVICSEGVIDSVIYHCGHMCTCTACGLELKSKALKCPICRAPITDVIRAYTSML